MRNLSQFLTRVFFLMVCAAPLAQAQTPTVVTGTITDPNGVPYSFAKVSAQLIPTTASPTVIVGGIPKQIGGQQNATADSTGTFSMNLFCNTAGGGCSVISPAGTQWQFTVTTPGISPPLGTGPQAFSASVTITGASQSVSTTLSTLAPQLAVGLGAAAVVTTNPLTCNTGQTFFNTVTSQFLLCIAPNTLNTASGATATTIDVTLFGVKAGKACIDGTVTNGSPNISSAGQCQWTSADVGKKIFVTNLCSVAVCSFGVGTSSITILPTQTTVARIGTVTDATHIIADCTAPGTCGSPNATATDSGQAVIVYGDDQTTNLNNAFASWTGQTGCPTFLYPDGLILYNAALFTTLPNLAANACTSPNISAGSGFKNLGQAIGNSAVTFMGFGPTSTLFVPTPDFNFASCTGPNGTGTSCFTGWLSPVFINIGIWGAGQSLLGAGVGGSVNLVGCRACIMLNTNFTNWAMRAASNTGIDFGGGAGFSYANNMYTNNFGGGTGGIVVSGSENQIVNSTIGVGGTSLLVNAGSTLQSSNNIYYGPSQFNAPTIDVLAAKFFSTNDHILSLNLATAPTPGLKVENGGYASVENLFYTSGSNANDSGISVAAGGVLHLKGWKSVFNTLTSGGNIAGSLFDECGNTYGGPLTVTGNIFGSCSVTGTALATGNIGLTSGWGTSSVATATGDSHAGRFTITGAAGAANPTLTLTFPTAYQQAPVCQLIETGANDFASLTNPVSAAASTTSDVFTLTGTPVAVTYQFDYRCGP